MKKKVFFFLQSSNAIKTINIKIFSQKNIISSNHSGQLATKCNNEKKDSTTLLKYNLVGSKITTIENINVKIE